ncbi:hypothetical protein NJB1907E39_02810, partial [Mycobacterium marinum]
PPSARAATAAPVLVAEPVGSCTATAWTATPAVLERIAEMHIWNRRAI